LREKIFAIHHLKNSAVEGFLLMKNEFLCFERMSLML